MSNSSEILRFILFADDTNLFFPAVNIGDICKTVTTELEKLNEWFIVNKLSLNLSKTNFMLFGKRHTYAIIHLSIDGTNIERVYTTKFLGVQINSKLSWNDHLTKIKSKVSKHIAVIGRIKKLLNSSALFNLYNTLIMPYIT